MEERITQLFKSIGLNKNETKVYLDLIRNNNSSALEISRRTKIHRSNTYDALNSLIEKGFVKETIEEKKKIFHSINPKQIRNYILQKKQEADLIIPHLIEFSEGNNKKESVSITKGVFALRNAILSLLELNQPINVYGIPKGSGDILGNGFLEDFHKKRINKKILMRHIYNAEASERIKKLNKMKYTEARHLARKYDTHVSTNICGDAVLIIIFTNPLSIIEIKSKEIADTYNKYFELLWTHAYQV